MLVLHANARVEAPLSTGYSPFLNFTVDDLDATMYKAMELGAAMDGAVVYADTGKASRLTSACVPTARVPCAFTPAHTHSYVISAF